MVRLHCLGSSSKGNAYVLDDGATILVLELGVKWQAILRAIDYQTQRIGACLVSHEHTDHARAVRDADEAFLPLVMSGGTAQALGVKRATQTSGQFGGFKVLSFGLKHDASEPLGFYIKHPDMGSLVFATDTYYIPYSFKGVQHYLIECNYSKELLFAGEAHPKHRDRVLQSHMSLDTCRDFLTASDLSRTQNIILLHLSDDNSNAQAFREDIYHASGGIPTYIAERGLTLQLGKAPTI